MHAELRGEHHQHTNLRLPWPQIRNQTVGVGVVARVLCGYWADGALQGTKLAVCGWDDTVLRKKLSRCKHYISVGLLAVKPA
jgi:hypothetical protein